MGLTNSKLRLPKSEMAYIKGRVSFSDVEINDWYYEFKKHCKKTNDEEYLAETDFIQVYNQVFPGDSSDYVRHIFRTFDTDGNGRVNFREFLIGLHVSGSDDLEKGLRWAFDVYDVSKNGVISKPEMAEIVRSVYKMLDPMRVKLPPEYATPELVVEKMFRVMDTDHDESLTWEEFKDGVLDDPFLFNLLQCNPPTDDKDPDVFHSD